MRNFLRLLRPPARPAAPKAPFDGRVDGFHAGAIEGWAVNNLDPSQPVKVAIHQNGSLIGEVAANAYRDDLREAGIGLGPANDGFSLPGPVQVRPLRTLVPTSVFCRGLSTGGG